MTFKASTNWLLAALLATLFALALLVLWVTEAGAQDVDFFEGMSQADQQKFLEAEGDLQLIKQGRKAPFYGVIITYKDFSKLWGEYQQGLVDLKAANEHIKVLEELVDTLQKNHKDDLLACKDDCDKRVQHCLDNYPQPVVIPCEPCVTEWYESPLLWAGVGVVAGVLLGGLTVYLFGGN